MIKQSWRKVAVGVAVLVIGAATVVFASGDTGADQVTCRTKAGYLRISNTGECRRSETVVDLPTAGDYNALVANDSALNDRLTALESTIDDMQATNDRLRDDVSDLKRRLPTVKEASGYLLFPGANLSGFDLSNKDLPNANLSYANLSYANLGGANLGGANLGGAYLTNAILSGAYLSGANLSGADLSGADLSGADLSGADLSNANLSNANLGGADLSGAYLGGANLGGANLSNADLSGAYLGGANLGGANLSNADLSGAALSGVSSGGITGTPVALPDGWSLVDGTLTYSQP